MSATLHLRPASLRAYRAILDIVYDPPRRAARPAPASLRPPIFDHETAELIRMFGFFVGQPERS